MKIIKRILLVFVVIIAIPLIAAIFIKKEYTVERDIVINKPKEDVFNYVKYLKNQNEYSKWALMDPHMKKEFRGTDGTVGFVSAWESDSSNVGKGEQEIKIIKEGDRIDYEIRFIKPFENTATSYMSTESVSPAQTKVKWSFHAVSPYPFNLMHVFMDFEKMIGDDLLTGLTNLKKKIEG
jgi:hypothetical protein